MPPFVGNAVKVTLVPAQIAPDGLAEINTLTGRFGLIVIGLVAVTTGHPPEAAIILVTV